MKQEIQDLLGYWLLPMLACILPWRWCWWLYRRAAQGSWLYPHESTAMQQGLIALEQEDKLHWPARFRLGWLLEQADLFLFYFSPRRHLHKTWMEPVGSWPEQRPFISLFFNFGFGLLVLEQMRQQQLHPSLVYAPPAQTRPQGMSHSRFAYMRLRQRAMEKACENRAIPTGGAWKKIQQAMAEKRTVVVVADAPSRPGNRTIPVQLFGQEGRWRKGVIELVHQAGLPAVVFRVRVDWDTGHRQLVISPPLDAGSEQTLTEDLLAIFQQGMQEHPETWLYWTALEAFLPGLNPARSDRQSSTMESNPGSTEQ